MNSTTHYIPAESEDRAMKRTLEILRYVTNLKLLTDLSCKCLRLSENEVKNELRKALEEFAGNIHADHAYLFYYDFPNHIMSNSIEWCKREIKSNYSDMKKLSTDGFDYWTTCHKNGNSIWVNNIETIPDGKVSMLLKQENAKGHASYPLMQEDNCIGFVGFDWIDDKRQETDTEKELIRRLADIVSAVSQRIGNEKELLKKVQKSEESDKMKSAFLASLGHELKTPLNAVMGYSDLLEKISNDDQTIKYSRIIHKNGGELLGRLDDILELAVAEQNPVEPKYESLRISDLTDDFEHEFDESLGKSEKYDKIKLSISTDDALLSQSILADRKKVNQIMSNLFRNALKYTNEGQIVVGVEKHNKDLLFWIKDTGDGISEDEQEGIFDFFKRGNDARICKNKGLGIGLAISKKMATVMDGQLSVKSRKGEGALFSLTIPFKSDPVAGKAKTKT